MDSYQTTSEAYLAVLATLLDRPDFVCSPRGMPISELLNYQFVVEHPSSESIVTRDPRRNLAMAGYLDVETTLYLSGQRRAEVWAKKASQFWAELANPDGTINSNYGWLAMTDQSLPNNKTPWEWAAESLTADRDSRQAYVKFAKRDHLWVGNRDQVCTLHMMFLIRGDRLHGTTVMRSNDAVRGLAYDMPWFCRLLTMMSDELDSRRVYAPVGTYTHLAHSLHLYKRDEAKALKMLGRIG